MTSIRSLSLRGFRSYDELDVEFDPGVTVIVGDNGNGKTNLIEAIAFASTLRSFRGVANDVLIGIDAEVSVVRATFDVEGRELLVEIELPRNGRSRVLLNRQRVAKRGELAAAVAVTVFAPDDLEIVKGSPSARREYVDDLMELLHPKNEAACAEFARVLKQRNALLKQLGGRLDDAAALTLDVWDERYALAGERLAQLRRKTVEALAPHVESALRDVAGGDAKVGVEYEPSWPLGGLADTLVGSRGDDVRRGVSTVGPHRDDVIVRLNDLPSRTHASQGEQRSLVLALRLAAHRLLTDVRGSAPLLLLDDVFSELDETRSAALLAALPAAQTIVTSALEAPSASHPDAVLRIRDSELVP
ncbi:MAG TPA: DNA replication/repair protein RecF [Microthrixaceae bacterium]|nr:DNA replication/repair protein RecF [Microthrixaceae bacterium]HMT22924.1 DNA replication/repair protein RecF [Microthrixaceae bacterium]HMT60562.1 DNA replication/repair protein RecF [Microthrixaceae bacterium]